MALQSSSVQRVMEGPLSKWTNVVHGWQYRWFVLDQTSGLLSYYTVSCYYHTFGTALFAFASNQVKPTPFANKKSHVFNFVLSVLNKV